MSTKFKSPPSNTILKGGHTDILNINEIIKELNKIANQEYIK